MNVRELAKLRAQALRPLLEEQALTYKQAAHRLGISVNAVASLADRFKIKTASPFSSPTKEGIRYVTAPKKVKVPKKPHQGFVKFTGLGEPTDAAPIKASAWDALPGSTPVSLDARTGCAWPISNDKPFSFCNLPVQEGKSWCAHHYTMGARVVAVGTAVRRSGTPDRYSL